jgi:hypothetical protein
MARLVLFDVSAGYFQTSKSLTSLETGNLHDVVLLNYKDLAWTLVPHCRNDFILHTSSIAFSSSMVAGSKDPA